MTFNQAYIFIVFTILGIIIGILFDLFRVLRRVFKTSDIITYIEDICFWIITGIIIIYAMYKYCDGELRFFMIIGIILGIGIYICTLSRFIIKTSLNIINWIKNIVIVPIQIFLKFTKKIIFQPIIIKCINFRSYLKKIGKKRGFFQKKEKYNSI